MLRDPGSNFPFLHFRKTFRRFSGLVFCVALSGLYTKPLLATTLPTTTALTVSPSTVAAQKPVTLTATVMANGTPATPGQVVFCVATATFCEDLNILGTAQVTSNGTASIKVLLGLGRHDIYAKFRGTTKYGSSSSLPAVQTVEVTGHLPSVATISTSGSPGNYSLTSTVSVFSTIPPTGTVAFNDATTLKAIASASLDHATSGVTLAQRATPVTAPGSTAQGSAVGDLNGDGYPDLVVTYQPDTVTPGSVSVQLGDPAHPGQFLTPHTYEVGVFPLFVAIGDFNGDGVADLAVTNSEDATVSVLLGDVTHPGQFLPRHVYTVGGLPAAIVIGDFDGDGLPDIAVSNAGGPGVSGPGVNVLMNNPASPGQFLPQVNYLPQGTADGLAVGDFNGDGLPDLAVVTEETLDGISVLLNNPASPGQFLAPVQYGAGEPSEVTVGDFNGDGIPDLALHVESFPDTHAIEVLLGDPAHPGQFLTTETYVIGTGDEFADYRDLSGDFNGDGILDIAVMISGSFQGVGLLLGDPAHPGQFEPQVDYPNLNNSTEVSIAVGDLNGDGLSDLAIGNEYLPSVVIQLANLTETATVSNLNPVSPTFVYADYPGDEDYRATYSCNISFPGPSKPAAPIISRPTVSNVTQTSATITWDSNPPTYGQVSYGTTAAFGSSTPWPFRVSPKHSFVLTNLTPGTKYDYQVKSVSYFSGCQHWTTTAPTAVFTTPGAN